MKDLIRKILKEEYYTKYVINKNEKSWVNIFNEALKPSQFRDYVKAFNRERYEGIFKSLGNTYENDRNYYRIYIPLNKTEKKGPVSNVEEEVTEFLKQNGYEVLDYVKGITKFGDAKNTTTIGKVLTRLKADDLMKKFVSDESRKALTSDAENLMVVISRHPYDIAGSDTDRKWTNCMTMGSDDEEEGQNVRYLIHDVKQGSLISYLIRKNDRNINNPLAVLNIKPYININNGDDFILVSDSKMYGNGRPEFRDTVDGILLQINGTGKQGYYCLNPNLYADQRKKTIYIPSPNEKEKDNLYFDLLTDKINKSKISDNDHKLIKKLIEDSIETIKDVLASVKTPEQISEKTINLYIDKIYDYLDGTSDDFFKRMSDNKKYKLRLSKMLINDWIRGAEREVLKDIVNEFPKSLSHIKDKIAFL